MFTHTAVWVYCRCRGRAQHMNAHDSDSLHRPAVHRMTDVLQPLLTCFPVQSNSFLFRSLNHYHLGPCLFLLWSATADFDCESTVFIFVAISFFAIPFSSPLVFSEIWRMSSPKFPKRNSHSEKRQDERGVLPLQRGVQSRRRLLTTGVVAGAKTSRKRGRDESSREWKKSLQDESREK